MFAKIQAPNVTTQVNKGMLRLPSSLRSTRETDHEPIFTRDFDIVAFEGDTPALDADKRGSRQKIDKPWSDEEVRARMDPDGNRRNSMPSRFRTRFISGSVCGKSSCAAWPPSSSVTIGHASETRMSAPPSSVGSVDLSTELDPSERLVTYLLAEDKWIAANIIKTLCCVSGGDQCRYGGNQCVLLLSPYFWFAAL